MRYHEPPLFPDDAWHVTEDDVVVMPKLPERPSRQRVVAGERERCDYCSRVQLQHLGDGPPPAGRRPQWVRTGTDGAQLLLCTPHALLLDPWNPSKKQGEAA